MSRVANEFSIWLEFGYELTIFDLDTTKESNVRNEFGVNAAVDVLTEVYDCLSLLENVWPTTEDASSMQDSGRVAPKQPN